MKIERIKKLSLILELLFKGHPLSNVTLLRKIYESVTIQLNDTV